MAELLYNLYRLTLDAAPFLLLGLLLAGLMKAWLPDNLLNRHLGGRGPLAVVKAALIGAPLPLCSCGVLPVAMGLRKGGASRGATVSFLVATPETGMDSIGVSYALLGPVMAVVRPPAAIVSALSAGLLAGWGDHEGKPPAPKTADNTTSCCATAQQSPSPTVAVGIRYTLTQLLDDIVLWLLLGLLFAALVKTFVPASWLASWGSGPLAMLVMVAIGVPMYICASASTPIAAGLMVAGVSPGTVLVFLLAGPATNIATLGIVRRELGSTALAGYLTGVVGVSIAMGLGLDWYLQRAGIDVVASMAQAGQMVPQPLALASALLLAVCAIKPLRPHLGLLPAAH